VIRLMQAIAGAEHGGAELFFVRLAKALQARGHPVPIAQHIATRPHSSRVSELRAAGIPVTELPFSGWFDFTTRRGLRQIIGRFKPHVVLTWMSRATHMCPRASPSVPFLHIARLGGYYDLKYYQQCEALIANTRDIADWILRQGWEPSRVHYLPNFVTVEAGPPASRVTMDTPAKAPLVVAMGRLHPNKAFDVLIRAVGAMPGVYCWILGEGPERPRLEALAAECGATDRIRMPGWRNDAAAYGRAADVLVCPSRHEPLGNVVLEAWAYQKPVLAAASIGPGALIAHERNGLLVPVDDPAAMAAGLTRLIEQRGFARRLAEAGHRLYLSTYTLDVVVAQYVGLLQNLLAARGVAIAPGAAIAPGVAIDGER
jgi:glycosyltransferase involved in cell wall biosynthesis